MASTLAEAEALELELAVKYTLADFHRQFEGQLSAVLKPPAKPADKHTDVVVSALHRKKRTERWSAAVLKSKSQLRVGYASLLETLSLNPIIFPTVYQANVLTTATKLLAKKQYTDGIVGFEAYLSSISQHAVTMDEKTAVDITQARYGLGQCQFYTATQAPYAWSDASTSEACVEALQTIVSAMHSLFELHLEEHGWLLYNAAVILFPLCETLVTRGYLQAVLTPLTTALLYIEHTTTLVANVELLPFRLQVYMFLASVHERSEEFNLASNVMARAVAAIEQVAAWEASDPPVPPQVTVLLENVTALAETYNLKYQLLAGQLVESELPSLLSSQPVKQRILTSVAMLADPNRPVLKSVLATLGTGDEDGLTSKQQKAEKRTAGVMSSLFVNVFDAVTKDPVVDSRPSSATEKSESSGKKSRKNSDKKSSSGNDSPKKSRKEKRDKNAEKQQITATELDLKKLIEGASTRTHYQLVQLAFSHGVWSYFDIFSQAFFKRLALQGQLADADATMQHNTLLLTLLSNLRVVTEKADDKVSVSSTAADALANERVRLDLLNEICELIEAVYLQHGPLASSTAELLRDACLYLWMGQVQPLTRHLLVAAQANSGELLIPFRNEAHLSAETVWPTLYNTMQCIHALFANINKHAIDTSVKLIDPLLQAQLVIALVTGVDHATSVGCDLKISDQSLVSYLNTGISVCEQALASALEKQAAFLGGILPSITHNFMLHAKAFLVGRTEQVYIDTFGVSTLTKPFAAFTNTLTSLLGEFVSLLYKYQLRIGVNTMKAKAAKDPIVAAQIDNTSKDPEGNPSYFNQQKEFALLRSVGANPYKKAVLLAQMSKCRATKAEQKTLLSDAMKLLAETAQAETEQLAVHGLVISSPREFVLDRTKQTSQEHLPASINSSRLGIPQVLSRTMNSVTLRPVVPGWYLRKYGVRSVVLYGKEASVGIDVSQHNTDLAGLGVELPVPQDQLREGKQLASEEDFLVYFEPTTVTGLVANKPYVFAMCAFDQKGKRIAGPGKTSPPVTPLIPLCLPQLWGIVATIASELPSPHSTIVRACSEEMIQTFTAASSLAENDGDEKNLHNENKTVLDRIQTVSSWHTNLPVAWRDRLPTLELDSAALASCPVSLLSKLTTMFMLRAAALKKSPSETRTVKEGLNCIVTTLASVQKSALSVSQCYYMALFVAAVLRDSVAMITATEELFNTIVPFFNSDPNSSSAGNALLPLCVLAHHAITLIRETLEPTHWPTNLGDMSSKICLEIVSLCKVENEHTLAQLILQREVDGVRVGLQLVQVLFNNARVGYDARQRKRDAEKEEQLAALRSQKEELEVLLKKLEKEAKKKKPDKQKKERPKSGKKTGEDSGGDSKKSSKKSKKSSKKDSKKSNSSRPETRESKDSSKSRPHSRSSRPTTADSMSSVASSVDVPAGPEEVAAQIAAISETEQAIINAQPPDDPQPQLSWYYRHTPADTMLAESLLTKALWYDFGRSLLTLRASVTLPQSSSNLLGINDKQSKKSKKSNNDDEKSESSSKSSSRKKKKESAKREKEQNETSNEPSSVPDGTAVTPELCAVVYGALHNDGLSAALEILNAHSSHAEYLPLLTAILTRAMSENVPGLEDAECGETDAAPSFTSLLATQTAIDSIPEVDISSHCVLFGDAEITAGIDEDEDEDRLVVTQEQTSVALVPSDTWLSYSQLLHLRALSLSVTARPLAEFGYAAMTRDHGFISAFQSRLGPEWTEVPVTAEKVPLTVVQELKAERANKAAQLQKAADQKEAERLAAQSIYGDEDDITEKDKKGKKKNSENDSKDENNQNKKSSKKSSKKSKKSKKSDKSEKTELVAMDSDQLTADHDYSAKQCEIMHHASHAAALASSVQAWTTVQNAAKTMLNELTSSATHPSSIALAFLLHEEETLVQAAKDREAAYIAVEAEAARQAQLAIEAADAKASAEKSPKKGRKGSKKKSMTLDVDDAVLESQKPPAMTPTNAVKEDKKSKKKKKGDEVEKVPEHVVPLRPTLQSLHVTASLLLNLADFCKANPPSVAESYLPHEKASQSLALDRIVVKQPSLKKLALDTAPWFLHDRRVDAAFISQFVLYVLQTLFHTERWADIVTLGLHWLKTGLGDGGKENHAVISHIRIAQTEVLKVRSDFVTRKENELAHEAAEFKVIADEILARLATRRSQKGKREEEAKLAAATKVYDNVRLPLEEQLAALNAKKVFEEERLGLLKGDGATFNLKKTNELHRQELFADIASIRERLVTFLENGGTAVKAVNGESYTTLRDGYKRVIVSMQNEGETVQQTRCMLELGDLAYHVGQYRDAQKAWSSLLDVLFGTMDCVKLYDEVHAKAIANVNLLSTLGVWTCMSGAIAAYKLGHYIFVKDMDMRRVCVSYGTALITALFGTSLSHPQSLRDFASYHLTELWPGLSHHLLVGSARRVKVGVLQDACAWLAAENIDHYDSSLQALPLICLYEHIALEHTLSIPDVALSLALRVRALVKLGMLNDASKAFVALASGSMVVRLPGGQPLLQNLSFAVVPNQDEAQVVTLGASAFSRHMIPSGSLQFYHHLAPFHELNVPYVRFLTNLRVLPTRNKLYTAYGSEVCSHVRIAQTDFLLRLTQTIDPRLALAVTEAESNGAGGKKEKKGADRGKDDGGRNTKKDRRKGSGKPDNADVPNGIEFRGDAFTQVDSNLFAELYADAQATVESILADDLAALYLAHGEERAKTPVMVEAKDKKKKKKKANSGDKDKTDDSKNADHVMEARHVPFSLVASLTQSISNLYLQQGLHSTALSSVRKTIVFLTQPRVTLEFGFSDGQVIDPRDWLKLRIRIISILLAQGRIHDAHTEMKSVQDDVQVISDTSFQTRLDRLHVMSLVQQGAELNTVLPLFDALSTTAASHADQYKEVTLDYAEYVLSHSNYVRTDITSATTKHVVKILEDTTNLLLDIAASHGLFAADASRELIKNLPNDISLRLFGPDVPRYVANEEEADENGDPVEIETTDDAKRAGYIAHIGACLYFDFLGPLARALYLLAKFTSRTDNIAAALAYAETSEKFAQMTSFPSPAQSAKISSLVASLKWTQLVATQEYPDELTLPAPSVDTYDPSCVVSVDARQAFLNAVANEKENAAYVARVNDVVERLCHAVNEHIALGHRHQEISGLLLALNQVFMCLYERSSSASERNRLGIYAAYYLIEAASCTELQHQFRKNIEQLGNATLDKIALLPVGIRTDCHEASLIHQEAKKAELKHVAAQHGKPSDTTGAKSNAKRGDLKKTDANVSDDVTLKLATRTLLRHFNRLLASESAAVIGKNVNASSIDNTMNVDIASARRELDIVIIDAFLRRALPSYASNYVLPGSIISMGGISESTDQPESKTSEVDVPESGLGRHSKKESYGEQKSSVVVTNAVRTAIQRGFVSSQCTTPFACEHTSQPQETLLSVVLSKVADAPTPETDGKKLGKDALKKKQSAATPKVGGRSVRQTKGKPNEDGVDEFLSATIRISTEELRRLCAIAVRLRVKLESDLEDVRESVTPEFTLLLGEIIHVFVTGGEAEAALDVERVQESSGLRPILADIAALEALLDDTHNGGALNVIHHPLCLFLQLILSAELAAFTLT